MAEAQDIVRNNDEPSHTDLARYNYNQFLGMKHALVTRRKQNGQTIESIAENLGLGVDVIRRFEDYVDDPKASLIRDYADAVGMRLTVVATPV